MHRFLSLLFVSLFLFISPLFFISPSFSEEPGQGEPQGSEIQLSDESSDSSDREPVEISDPLEGFNRAIFWFNDKVDVYVLEPVASGYDYVLPKRGQKSVTNFFNNLRFPTRFVSSLMQLKLEETAVHTGRFLLNTTLGLGGLFDVAEGLGLEAHPDDIGHALRNWGIPEGPYLVIPFLGPSTLRDFLGDTVERSGLQPINALYWSEIMDTEDVVLLDAGTTILNIVNTRASLLEAVKAGKEASTDFYLFVQGAYYQRRDGQFYHGEISEDDWFDDDDF